MSYPAPPPAPGLAAPPGCCTTACDAVYLYEAALFQYVNDGINPPSWNLRNDLLAGTPNPFDSVNFFSANGALAGSWCADGLTPSVSNSLSFSCDGEGTKSCAEVPGFSLPLFYTQTGVTSIGIMDNFTPSPAINFVLCVALVNPAPVPALDSIICVETSPGIFAAASLAQPSPTMCDPAVAGFDCIPH